MKIKQKDHRPLTLGQVMGDGLRDEIKAREDAKKRRQELDDMGFRPIKVLP